MYREKIIDIIRKNIIYDLIKPLTDRYKIIYWYLHGKHIPPPPAIKQKTVKKYAKKFCIHTLVETGTCLGDMVYSTRNIFNKIFSIELDKILYKKTKKRLEKLNNITLIQGDSSELLPEILNHINEPCLFWLDAHYSGGFTAKGNLETPIIKEIEHIFSHHISKHVILIDDARCFNGSNDYPTVHYLKKIVRRHDKDLEFKIRDDIIRICPKIQVIKRN
jgi:hypothetical protein